MNTLKYDMIMRGIHLKSDERSILRDNKIHKYNDNLKNSTMEILKASQNYNVQ